MLTVRPSCFWRERLYYNPILQQRHAYQTAEKPFSRKRRGPKTHSTGIPEQVRGSENPDFSGTEQRPDGLLIRHARPRPARPASFAADFSGRESIPRILEALDRRAHV